MSYNLNHFFVTIFGVLLTIKLTEAANISWLVTCSPLFCILGLFLLSILLVILVNIAKKVKGDKNSGR